MAATVVTFKRTKMLGEYCVIADITLDASYPTGGYALTPGQFGLTTIDFIIATDRNGYSPDFDLGTQKLLLYTTAVTQVTAATNLATLTIRVMATGT